jgi:hypothetical protein
MVTAEDGVTTERGRWSGRLWRRDIDGLVAPDSDSRTVFDRILDDAVHKPDRRVRMLGVTIEYPRRYVLEIVPNPSINQLRYFDARTFVHTETVTKDYDGRISVDRYSDYVRYGARWVAGHQMHSDNLSAQRYETTLVRNERLPFNARLVAMPRSRMPFVADYSLPMTINSLFGRYGILVRADIAGQPYWLKLDSGAGQVLFDRSLIRSLGLREVAPYTSTQGGRVDQTVAIVPRVDVGPMYAKNLVVQVVRFGWTENGVHVSGALGSDFIASTPLEIDFRNQTVTAVNRVFATPGWTTIATPLQQLRPTVELRLGNQTAKLLLDLGAPYTLLNEDVLDRIDPAANRLSAARISYIGGELLDAIRYAVPQASLEGLDLSPLVVTSVPGGRGQDLTDDGVLGFNVLRNYRLVLDYQHQVTSFQRYATELSNGE